MNGRWQRIVVKVGTSTLTGGGDRLDPPRMVDLVRQISELRGTRRRRGAGHLGCATGRARPAGADAGRERTIPLKQMLAAVGQGRLMHLWEQYLISMGSSWPKC